MKVGTSHQITLRQSPEDRKYGTYGEHLKKSLRVGLYTRGPETVTPDTAYLVRIDMEPSRSYTENYSVTSRISGSCGPYML